jgi:hypothetical protein
LYKYELVLLLSLRLIIYHRMKLLITLCIALIAASASAQDVTSAAYLKETTHFWNDIKKKELELAHAKTILVRRESYPHKGFDKKDNEQMFARYMENVSNVFPAKVYKREVVGTTYTGGHADSIAFTADERKAIVRYFKSKRSYVWPKAVLDDAALISQSVLDSLYKLRRKANPTNPDGYTPEYFALSLPLFLKNNTVAIFYYGHQGGNVGYGPINVYIKRNGSWEKFEELWSWEI